MTASSDFALEPLPGLVDLAAPTIHHVQALTAASGTLTVTTMPEQWAYAVSFEVMTRTPWNMGGRVLIRVTGWVSSGCVGVLLAGGATGAAPAEVFRTPSDGLTEFDLWTDALGGGQAVVIRNAAAGPSTMTIESIRAYGSLGRGGARDRALDRAPPGDGSCA